jgi:hypothetical protein
MLADTPRPGQFATLLNVREQCMNNKNGKWWLAAVVICCLAPAAFADQGFNPHSRKKPKQQVPEGGSTAIYLLGAGLTCFGAMFLRSKLEKPAQL